MTNASIEPIVGTGSYRVIAFKEFRCPACGHFLCEVEAKTFIRIPCGKCRARWRIENLRFEMISPPQKIKGKLWKDMDRSEVTAIMSGQMLQDGIIA